MKRLDFYKFHAMIMIFLLEMLTLLTCVLVTKLVLPILLAVLYVEMLRFIGSLHSIEEVERTGEILTLVEKVSNSLLWFNSFLILVAIMIATSTHFLG